MIQSLHVYHRCTFPRMGLYLTLPNKLCLRGSRIEVVSYLKLHLDRPDESKDATLAQLIYMYF